MEMAVPKWKARNRGIPFHAKNCESDHGDYKGIPHETNKALYKELVGLMVKSEIGGFGIAFDLAAQRRVIPGALDFAYYAAFTYILEKMAKGSIHFRQVSRFKFDISTKNEYNAGLIYANFRENMGESDKLFSREISFGSASEMPRLQVADLLAYECMKVIDHATGPIQRTRKSWDALVATKRFACLCYGEQWFSDLKKDLPKLERKLGFDQDKYINWLREHNRQHNEQPPHLRPLRGEAAQTPILTRPVTAPQPSRF